jgi:ssDNA-binding Zn-finger/Zn-ribbon topoisomerase 1
MKQANRRAGGQSFWGCSRYPQCRGSRPMPGLDTQLKAVIATLTRQLRRLTRLWRGLFGRRNG